MDKIELKDGTSVECKALTKNAYEDLLKNNTATLLNEFRDKYNITVHKLNNGHTVVKDGDYYTLYFSLNDLNLVLIDAFGKESNSHEILLNKNPYHEHFPDKTKDLIIELCKNLNIKFSRIDSSLIRQVDEKIIQAPKSDEIKKKHLLHFIALIGEVIKGEYNGKWKMQLSPDGVTWNPYLIINNQKIEFFTYIYEDIYISDSKGQYILNEIHETVKSIIEQNLR